MATLLEFQTRLADAVLRGDRGLALPLFQGSDERRNLGLKVYANNLMHALVSALRETFPVVRGILGETTFTSLAVAYARENPPARDALLLWYGAGLPRFLDAIDVAGAPYLAELARLEYAWLQAYHAPEAVPLAPPALATLTAEQLLAARPRFHPSVRLLCAAHDIARIWQRHRDGLGVADTAECLDRATRLVILRPFAEIVVLPASESVFDCLNRLRDGALFGEACGHLSRAEHLAELQVLIATGLFTDIEMET